MPDLPCGSGMLVGVSAQEAQLKARRLAARAAGRHPTPVTAGRGRNMQAIRRTDTKPEVALRSALHRAGLRFRKDYLIRVDGQRVRPDIVFTRARLAVFIDGCFWHSCPEHGRLPTTNVDYWGPKFRRNVERDRKQSLLLKQAGWTALRIWEHDTLYSATQLVLEQYETSRHA